MSNITKWLWPVPGTKVGDVSDDRWFYSGHEGIDVWVLDIEDDDAIASRDGKVVMILSGCVNKDAYSKYGVSCGSEIGCSAPLYDGTYTFPDGTVVDRKYCNDTVGNMVILEHDVEVEDGIIEKRYSQYCHLKTICVSHNQTVEQGEKIGTVGSTGMSSGAHLHFSISKNITEWGDSRVNNNPYDHSTSPGEFEYFDRFVDLCLNYTSSDNTMHKDKLLYNVDNANVIKDSEKPSRTGYTFAGWHTHRTNNTEVTTFSQIPEGTNILYAHWTESAPKITVTFKQNTESSGGPDVCTQVYTIGGTYTPLPAAPDRDSSFKFLGWWPDGDKRQYEFTENTEVKSIYNHSLYAHWEYDIELYANSDDAEPAKTVTAKTSDTYGSHMSAEMFTKCGYKHTGWTYDEEGTEEVNLNDKVDNVTTKLYAKWEKKEMDIIFNYNINGVTNTSAKVIYGEKYGTNVPSNETVQALEPTGGYEFLGWYHPEVTGDTLVTCDTPHALYGTWKQKEPMVTFNPDCEVINSDSFGSVRMKCNEPYGIVPTPIAKDPYVKFNGWDACASDGELILAGITSDTIVASAEDHILLANWSDRTQVYVDYDDGNGYQFLPDLKYYGTTYSFLVPKDKPGYEFVCWFFDASMQQDTTYHDKECHTYDIIIPEHPCYIRAHYKQTVPVTYELYDGECNDIPDVVCINDVYPLPVPTREDYEFTGWYYDEECTLPVGENDTAVNAEAHTLYAGWRRVAVTVTFDAGDSTFAEDVSPIKVLIGEPYGELPAPKSADNYLFRDWTIVNESGEITEYIASTSTVTADSDFTLTAEWLTKRNLQLDPDGGTVSISYRPTTFGKPYPIIPTPTKDGYDFIGWYFVDGPFAGVQCVRDSEFLVHPDHPGTVRARWVEAAASEE